MLLSFLKIVLPVFSHNEIYVILNMNKPLFTNAYSVIDSPNWNLSYSCTFTTI